MLMTMTTTETLDYLSFVVAITVNVLVAFWVFPMWHRRRLRFFPILGFAALLGIFTTVGDWAWSRHPMSKEEADSIWCALGILDIIDLTLYAVGIGLMVRYFRATQTSPVYSQNPPSNEESA